MSERTPGWHYPFDLPDSSYALNGGRYEPGLADGFGERAGSLEPILAVGSNGAPTQLLRKFGAQADVPVSQHVVPDQSIVYSAHVTTYGAVPATLVQFDGAASVLFVTWLTAAQRARMDESEGIGLRYRHHWVDMGSEFELTFNRRQVLAYESVSGPFCHLGAPIMLAEVASSGGSHPRLMQTAMLSLVARLLGHEGSDGQLFSTRLQLDEIFRQEVNAALADFSLERSEVSSHRVASD